MAARERRRRRLQFVAAPACCLSPLRLPLTSMLDLFRTSNAMCTNSSSDGSTCAPRWVSAHARWRGARRGVVLDARAVAGAGVGRGGVGLCRAADAELRSTEGREHVRACAALPCGVLWCGRAGRACRCHCHGVRAAYDAFLWGCLTHSRVARPCPLRIRPGQSANGYSTPHHSPSAQWARGRRES